MLVQAARDLFGNDDVAIGISDSYAGAYFTSSSFGPSTASIKGGGLGVEGQISILGFFLDTNFLRDTKSYPRIRGGDLISIETGIGYQSPPGGSLGSAWWLIHANLGVQGFVAFNALLEVGLRYYYFDEGDLARDENAPFKNEDHVWVAQPSLRYDHYVGEVGFKASGDAGTASYITLKLRYLKKGRSDIATIFYGLDFEHFGITPPPNSQGPVADASSFTVRATFGVQY